MYRQGKPQKMFLLPAMMEDFTISTDKALVNSDLELLTCAPYPINVSPITLTLRDLLTAHEYITPYGVYFHSLHPLKRIEK